MNTYDHMEYKKHQLILEQGDRLNVYRLTNGKGPSMQALVKRAEEYLKNHSANMKRMFVNKVRGLIEWSIQEYERAKMVMRDNMSKYKELILFWAPERVLAVQKFFQVMRHVLQDVDMWNMLDRKERRFIVKALDFATGRR